MPRGRKPSKLTQNTDMKPDSAYYDVYAPPRKEGDPTGQTGDLEAQTSSTPPINQEAALTSAPANVGPLPSPVNIAAPTAKQFEPNTAGIPVGPGSNGPRVVATNTLQNFLTVAKEITQDPIFDELLAEDIIQEPVVNPEQDDYFGF
jgi:hypothetical protein